jgi:hypothetical protein
MCPRQIHIAGISMTEERKHAVLFAAKLLTARRLIDMAGESVGGSKLISGARSSSCFMGMLSSNTQGKREGINFPITRMRKCLYLSALGTANLVVSAWVNGCVQVRGFGEFSIQNQECLSAPNDVTHFDSRLWSEKTPSSGFQRTVTLLHSDRRVSAA